MRKTVTKNKNKKIKDMTLRELKREIAWRMNELENDELASRVKKEGRHAFLHRLAKMKEEVRHRKSGFYRSKVVQGGLPSLGKKR